jgi:hypothetical protein
MERGLSALKEKDGGEHKEGRWETSYRIDLDKGVITGQAESGISPCT